MDTSLPNSQDQLSEASTEMRIAEIQQQLRDLERRDWWLWSLAVVVMLCLTVGIFSLSFPELVKDNPFFQFGLSRAVRGLIGLVLIFNSYSIYQQVTIKRLRQQFSRQLREMGMLQVRAQEFHRLATTDPLTGLANRRTAQQRLTAEAERSRRHGHPLTLVSFDLNNFKEINDQFGHPAGDQVLQAFAGRLAGAVRLSDLAVRMGGDEFLVILPECRIEQVPNLVARLRPIQVNFQAHRIPVEFSVGCVDYTPGETAEEFLQRVDQTLYADKRAGKARREVQPALN